MRQHDYRVFADYFQFYVFDAETPVDFSEAWSQTAVQQGLTTVPGGVGVATARNMTVPVTVEIHSEPPAAETGYDRMDECELRVTSGTLVVMGATDYQPDAPRLEAAPGTYAVRVYSYGLNTLSPDGLDGSDRYKLVLWPVGRGAGEG